MTLLEPRAASRPERGRARAVGAWALAAGMASSACQDLLGGVEVSDAPAPAAASPAPQVVVTPPLLLPAPGTPVPSNPEPSEAPASGAPLLPSPPAPVASADAGGSSGDAGPPPAPARPIGVEPPSPLALVGFEGGGPRLGTCQDGILMGVRPTANPGTDTFGQRLVFIEPICARASLLPNAADPAAVRVALTRDDALLLWDATEPLLGPPSWEVPDERLIWVAQPEVLCPEATPALVGLTGAYDPPADDGSGTAIIRSLVLECAPLALAVNGSDVTAAAEGHLLISRADSFAATGSAEYRSACEGGTALSQLLIHSGFWLDGFVLGCSSLHDGEGAALP